MPDLESTNVVIAGKQEETPSSDTKYITLGNTTFEVVSNYVGKSSLLDIVRNAIKRDIESGNY